MASLFNKFGGHKKEEMQYGHGTGGVVHQDPCGRPDPCATTYGTGQGYGPSYGGPGTGVHGGHNSGYDGYGSHGGYVEKKHEGLVEKITKKKTKKKGHKSGNKSSSSSDSD